LKRDGKERLILVRGQTSGVEPSSKRRGGNEGGGRNQSACTLFVQKEWGKRRRL